MEIDRIDRKILSVLQKNNRIANVELAEEVGLSPPACLKRVKRLRAGKVIVGDVSIINPSLAGNKMTLIVSVEMERDRGDIYSVFRQSIEKAPEVTQCYQITGGYDFMLIVSVSDIQAYERFIERVLQPARDQFSNDLESKIRLLLENWLNWNHSFQGSCMFLDAWRSDTDEDNTVQQSLIKGNNKWIRYMEIQIEKAKHTGVFSVELDTKQAVYQIYGVYLSSQLFYAIDGEDESRERFWKSIDFLFQHWR